MQVTRVGLFFCLGGREDRIKLLRGENSKATNAAAMDWNERWTIGLGISVLAIPHYSFYLVRLAFIGKLVGPDGL